MITTRRGRAKKRRAEEEALQTEKSASNIGLVAVSDRQAPPTTGGMSETERSTGGKSRKTGMVKRKVSATTLH